MQPIGQLSKAYLPPYSFSGSEDISLRMHHIFELVKNQFLKNKESVSRPSDLAEQAKLNQLAKAQFIFDLNQFITIGKRHNLNVSAEQHLEILLRSKEKGINSFWINLAITLFSEEDIKRWEAFPFVIRHKESWIKKSKFADLKRVFSLQLPPSTIRERMTQELVKLVVLKFLENKKYICGFFKLGNFNKLQSKRLKPVPIVDRMAIVSVGEENVGPLAAMQNYINKVEDRKFKALFRDLIFSFVKDSASWKKNQNTPDKIKILGFRDYKSNNFKSFEIVRSLFEVSVKSRDHTARQRTNLDQRAF